MCQPVLLRGSGTRKQDSVTASAAEPTLAPKPKRKREKISPAQMKRDRVRLIKWRRKHTRKADTGSVLVSTKPTTSQAAGSDPAVTSSEEFNSTIVLPQESPVQVDHSLQPQVTVSVQDIPVHSDNPLQVDLSACTSSGTSSESELDSEDEDIHDIDVQEFCANCFRRPEGLVLKRCTRCMLSLNCSVKCHRENWSERKVTCSLITAHGKTVKYN